MAIEIVMPKLGWTMEEGILDEWIKQDGDEVAPGDIIFVVESDKALQEIEAFDGGILRIAPDAPPVGSTVKIGEVLAYLVRPGEAPPFARSCSRCRRRKSSIAPAIECIPSLRRRRPVTRSRSDARDEADRRSARGRSGSRWNWASTGPR